MKRLALALILISMLPLTAAARDAFKNLPGVRDPAAKQEVQLDVICTSRFERAWPSRFPARNGLAQRIYSCEDGSRIAIGSNRPPDMIEYRKFKQYYQSN